MWTGRQTIATLEQAIARLNAEEGQLDTALRQASAEAERLRRERGVALRELARVKLGEIEAGRLIRDLDPGERRALQILTQRRDRLTALAEQRLSAVDEVEKAGVTRHDAAAQVEAALEAVTTRRNEVEARVAAMPGWQALQQAFDAADKVAEEAERKAQQSEDERLDKRRPYDNDPLFIYLWRSGFGTEAYRAGHVVRYMDRQVADFIGYIDARSSYAMLLEIPVRLREHADERRRIADDHKADKAAFEHKEMEAAGVPALERTLAEARHRLAAVDDAAEQKIARLKHLDAQRDELLSTDDSQAYRSAMEAMVSADSTDTLTTLREEAGRTETQDDERIVRTLETIDERIEAADKEAAELRRSAKELADRRLEIERTRTRMHGSGYDHPDVVFGNESAIGEAIEQIVRGALRSGMLWDLLQAGFGTRPRNANRDFGMPFPFPLPGGDDGPRGGEWRWPTSSGGWEPRGRGDADEDDRDGFTTGGRF